MVICYSKILNFLVILMFILNHIHLHSLCLFIPFHKITEDMHRCLSIIITLGGYTNHNL